MSIFRSVCGGRAVKSVSSSSGTLGSGVQDNVNQHHCSICSKVKRRCVNDRASSISIDPQCKNAMHLSFLTSSWTTLIPDLVAERT